MFWQTQNPIREALEALCRATPPAFVKGYDLKSLTDQQMTKLQDWCSVNAKPEWATGLSIIEAAERIVQEAVDNANIEPPPKEEESSEGSKASIDTFKASIRGSELVTPTMDWGRPLEILKQRGSKLLVRRAAHSGWSGRGVQAYRGALYMVLELKKDLATVTKRVEPGRKTRTVLAELLKEVG